ncbi:MAG: asparagine synthase C-terminal domain-containing protein [bacterium]|nr:asparagine synthase C-terminal domain-containing protein [bacterium]
MGYKDFIEAMPAYTWHMDEPVADPAAIPLYFVSKLAKEHVTVVLSGEGSDELLAGYTYWMKLWDYQLRKYYLNIPNPIRRRVNSLARALPFQKLKNFVDRASSDQNIQNLHSTTEVFREEGKAGLLNNEFRQEVGQINSLDILDYYNSKTDALDYLNRMLYMDSKLWLPEDLLMKADKMTMAHSLELRVPFLDHELVTFIAGMPSNLKSKGKTSKYILKKAMRGILPDELIDRKKQGFPVPINRFFKHEMREFVSEILLSQKAKGRDYFNSSHVENLLKRHQEEGTDHSAKIWVLLVFELWCREYIDV